MGTDGTDDRGRKGGFGHRNRQVGDKRYRSRHLDLFFGT